MDLARGPLLSWDRPGDDKTIDQNIVAARDRAASRKIEHPRAHYRKLGVFQMNWDSVKCHTAPWRAVVLIPKNDLTGAV